MSAGHGMNPELKPKLPSAVEAECRRILAREARRILAERLAERREQRQGRQRSQS